MSFYALFLYLALALMLVYSIVLIVKRLKKAKRQKSVPKKKFITKKVVALSAATGQHFRLNLMAMEAARQMAAVVAKHYAEDK